MGYTKNSWQSGDIITKIKLDNMEDGIAGAYGMFITITVGSDGEGHTTFTMDKTYSEILSAMESGKYVCSFDNGALELVVQVNNLKVITATLASDFTTTYTAASENDYPVFTNIAP